MCKPCGRLGPCERVKDGGGTRLRAPALKSLNRVSLPPLQINGRPFVVREADKPFQNLEYTGIDRSRVEDMEARLKSDVLREVVSPSLPRPHPRPGPSSLPSHPSHTYTHTCGAIALATTIAFITVC